MSSKQRSPYPLLNAIQEQIHDENVFKSIKFENVNTKYSSTYDLSFLGLFLSLSENQIPSFSIFLPNYLSLIDSRQPEKVLFLLASNQKSQYNFIFSTKDDAKKFYDISLTILERLQSLSQNINLNFCKVNEELICLLPNSSQISNSNVFVGFEKDNSGNHAVLNVESITDSKKGKKPKKTSKSKQKEKGFYLELKMSSKINVTQPAEIPKTFGENTFRKVTAEVYQNENEKCLILCKTVEESLNLILSIYFLSHSLQDLNSQKFMETSKLPTIFLTPPKPSPSFFKSVDQETKPKVSLLSEIKKEKQIKMPQIEIKPQSPTRLIRPDTVIIPDDVFATSVPNTNIDNSKKSPLPPSQAKKKEKEEKEKGDDFIIEFEEIIVSNAKENKMSQRLIDYERSTRSRTNTLSRKSTVGSSRRRSTITRRGNINLKDFKKRDEKNNNNDENDNENVIDFSYFRPSSTSSADIDGNCENSLEKVNKMIISIEDERKKIKKNQSVEDSLPDFETYIKNLSLIKPEMVTQGNSSNNALLEKAYETLESNSYDDNFTSIKQSSKKIEKTEEIVKKSIDFFSEFSVQSGPECTDDKEIFDFFDFKSFPAYNYDEFIISSEPHLNFIDKLVSIIQSIEVKKITKLYSDTGGLKRDQIGQKLTAIIAAIFINGLRGFDRANDISSRDYEVCNTLIGSIRIISGTIPDLVAIVNQMTKMVKNGESKNSGCDIATLAAVLAAMMLNEGVLIRFLRTVQKNHEWINRFYLPTSIMASPHLINMSIVLLTPLFCNVQFLLSIESAGNCFFNKSPKFVENIVKTPIQGFLEVDPFILLSMDHYKKVSSTPSSSGISSISSMSSASNLYLDLSNNKNAADFRSAFQHSVVHQFAFGLKQSFIKVPEKQRQFAFINEVANSNQQIVCKSKNKEAWKEFVETTKFLKSNNGVMIKEMNYIIDEWVSIGLEKKLLHIWFLFLGVNTEILNKFYHPCSTFADPYRLKFVTKAIVKFYKLTEQINQD